MDKFHRYISMLAGMLLLVLISCPGTAKAESENFLRRGQTTVIDSDKQFNAYVKDWETARDVIVEYGIRQRALYDNPEVKEIELQMEKDYDILAVNLGEIDVEAAREIEQAFAYMYEEYPILQGTLTNLTLSNFPNTSGNELAITRTRELVVNETFGTCPFVVKYEILLNVVRMSDREKMLVDYKKQAADGHWPEGTGTTSIIVHELGHQLMEVIRMMQYGLYDGKEFTAYYITEENHDAFSDCIMDSLSINQTVNKTVIEEAYQLWIDQYGETGDEEAFRSSISEYASGIQSDGGISYGETISEAIADYYLHGEDSVNATKAIISCINDRNYL